MREHGRREFLRIIGASARSDKAYCRIVRRPHAILLSAVVLAAACDAGREPATSSADVAYRDSAGVVIVQHAAGAVPNAARWSVDTIPELVIGRVDGAEPYQFHRIEGIRGLPGDRIVVADRTSRQLRFFVARGEFELARGSEGDGPGEFRTMVLLPGRLDEPITIYDTRHRRFTSYSDAGELLGQVSAPGGRGYPVGTVGGRALMFHTVIVFSATTTFMVDPAEFLILDLDTGSAIDLGTFPGQGRVLVAEAPLPVSLGAPFDVMPSATAGLRNFYVTAGEAAEIMVYDTLGGLSRIIRTGEPPRGVDRTRLERQVDERFARVKDVPALRRVLDRVPLPDAMPAYQSLLVDDIGCVWAAVYRAFEADPAEWVVFTPDGELRATVELPRDLEVHHIGVDHVRGRWRDELRVEYVRRHRLDRGRDRSSSPAPERDGC